ncbi:MAG: hypothetical protein CFE21_18075 [Bacteroidetes bacterium B1(2017)]|nr:MAG: hypothetical protein CFE21_18075 [Bacteroidetes bacterium B1(2017)]
MKTKLYLSLLFFLLSIRYTYSQSTTLSPQGVMFPQMSTTQINALVNPIIGTLIYNTTTNSYWYRHTNNWSELNTPNFWSLTGAAGNEIKNTNSGGFWSSNSFGLNESSDNTTHPPTAPMSGPSTRLMWIPSRSAFRAGTAGLSVHDNQGAQGSDSWDAENIGLFSIAFGFNTKASGRGSNAFGISNIASGFCSTALGFFNKSSGYASLSSGTQSEASGSLSTTLGYQNEAKSDFSQAFGRNNIVNSVSSCAIGLYNNDYYPANSVDPNGFLFTIGNGDALIRRNCFEVRKTGVVQINHFSPAQDNPDRYGLRIKRDVATGLQFWTISHPSNENLDFHYGASGAFKAYVRQSDGAWMQSSDVRLKEQIKPVESLLHKVAQLKVSRYFYKTDTLHTSLQMGLIAQEVQPLFPEFITQNGQYYGVNYGGMSVVALKAIQELKAENDKLKSELQTQALQIKEILKTLKGEDNAVMETNINQLKN